MPCMCVYVFYIEDQTRCRVCVSKCSTLRIKPDAMYVCLSVLYCGPNLMYICVSKCSTLRIKPDAMYVCLNVLH